MATARARMPLFGHLGPDAPPVPFGSSCQGLCLYDFTATHSPRCGSQIKIHRQSGGGFLGLFEAAWHVVMLDWALMKLICGWLVTEAINSLTARTG